MSVPRFTTVTEQVIEALRRGLREGRWREQMPGRLHLARELGVNHKTVEIALQVLEKEGLLEPRGAGRPRGIVCSRRARPARLRIGMLLYEDLDLMQPFTLNLLHRLEQAGFEAFFSAKSMRALGMDCGRIAEFIEQTPADAWVVLAGPREVLEWFAAQAKPAFALFGRSPQVPLPGTYPYKTAAVKELVARLVELGHRRIVFWTRAERRLPGPGFLERRFLEELEKHGIRTGAYNLPDWEDSRDGLHPGMEALFRHTPPTALIVDDVALFFPVMQYLASRGITAPEKISLACTDADPHFAWCQPVITHITWDSGPLCKRVVDWARRIGRGQADRRKRPVKAELVSGGTIGPVPG